MSWIIRHDHGNIVTSRPKTMQEAIEMATELMDKRVSTIAERQAENKRKFENTSRNNQNQQQQQNKRQNTGQAYTAGNSDRKSYAGSKPLCFLRSRPVNANNNNNNNQKGNGCYECGAQGHFRRNYPKLRNNDRGNQAGNDRAPAKVSQIDITPSTLDHYYDVELADGRIIGYTIILNGAHKLPKPPDFNINLIPVELGSFDAINGMIGLAKYQVVMMCAEEDWYKMDVNDCRLISWQCKKQTVVVNSTIEAEYIAASNCCGHVLWIQNQLLDYGYNFMQTKIHIDNESTICIVKNLVFHSKTKHIEIRHHFIRDSNEKKLIQMIKIHTNQNVADLLTKAFDVSRFQYLIASIRMLNLWY
ncbi:putative ribonuclease H-like domain-containing protein [Tanacetum coccineum]